jgi:hypothetical protein
MELPEYLSDAEDDGNKEIRKNPKTKRKRKWKRECVFTSKQESDLAIQQENLWSFHYSNATFEGQKNHYRCNKVKSRGRQCDAGLYLFHDATNNEIVLFRCDAEHTHDDLDSLNSKMSLELQKEIKNLHEFKLKPKAILEALHEKQFQVPSIVQLKYFLTKIKKENYGPTTISLGELEQWCLESSQIPQDLDTPFVVSYEVIYDDEFGDDEDVDGQDGPRLRFFISTQRLLTMASTSVNIHADATYKLVWQGFPILIVGTTDLDRHFHPFGMAVCTNEEKQDFKFVFQSLIDGVEKNHQQKIQPEVLIADSANAIRNAFLETFGEKQMIMCWAHVYRNVIKKVSSLVSKNQQIEMISDIETLQLSQSKKVFDRASNLFLKKWRKGEPEFIKYFEHEWLKSHNLWYEGAKHFTPSTNNALESFNRVIKDESTLRERQPLSRFRILALKTVEKWSKEYANQSKEFKTEATVTLELWTKGYQWAKMKKNVSSVDTDTTVEFSIPSGEELAVSQSDIIMVKSLKWNTFQQFKEKAFSVWFVTLPKEKSQWMKGICNCPSFFKKYMCKHVVGLAIRSRFCTPPVAAKNIPIGQKRRRGRPSKAKKALLIQ